MKRVFLLAITIVCMCSVYAQNHDWKLLMAGSSWEGRCLSRFLYENKLDVESLTRKEQDELWTQLFNHSKGVSDDEVVANFFAPRLRERSLEKYHTLSEKLASEKDKYVLKSTVEEDGVTREWWVIQDEFDNVQKGKYVYKYKKGGSYVEYDKKHFYENDKFFKEWNFICKYGHKHTGNSIEGDEALFQNGTIIKSDKTDFYSARSIKDKDCGLVGESNRVYRGPYTILYLPGQDEAYTCKFDKGFLIKDRIYQVTVDGKLIPRYYWVKDMIFPLPINATDTIIERKVYKDENGKKVVDYIYANGDLVRETENSGTQFKLHRSGGVLKGSTQGHLSGRSGYNNLKIDFPEGSSFTFSNLNKVIMAKGPYERGLIISEDTVFQASLEDALMANEYVFYYGSLTKADGTSEVYFEGKTKAQIEAEHEARIAAEKAQKEAEQAQKAANEKKTRDSYIKKYGFYPGDYKRAQDAIKVGRPFGAIEEFYICKLVRDNGTAKQYKVLILNSLTNDNLNISAYVWVQNGKITSVRW